LEHEECECTGKAFYGMAQKSQGQKEGVPLAYEEMLLHSHMQKEAGGVIDCNSKSFGGDPTPGHSKQCYCQE